MCWEQDTERKVKTGLGMFQRKEENNCSEEMHKNECDWSGGQRCSEENVEKLCQPRDMIGYGY